MALPGVTINLGSGGLGRAATSLDGYSLMLAYYYASSVNSAYANIGDKPYNSLADAEADGIVDTCAEATAATAAHTVTAAGTNGDTATYTFTGPDGTVYNLGTYTKVSGDNTVTLVATGIVAVINATTYVTGISATVGTSGAYTITFPKTWGIWPNSKSVTITLSNAATLAITNNAASGGTASPLAMFHYQIAEYFRGCTLNGANGAPLYFKIGFDDSSTLVAAFNSTMQTDLAAANAKFNNAARQSLVYNPFRTFATSMVDAAKAYRTTSEGLQTPTVVYVTAKNSGALSAQPNLRALSDAGAAATCGQSGSGTGYLLSLTQNSVIGMGGIVLGVTSLAAVSQSIGEVQAFNISDGVEYNTSAFFDGTDVKTTSVSQQAQLNDYGWIFGRKFNADGLTGTYINKGNCAVSTASDYANIESCRTIDKARRGVYNGVSSLLNSRLTLNADGTLSEATASIFEEKAGAPLAQMVRDGDLSAYQVSVSRTEVVATSNTVKITIRLLPIGIAEFITITLTYTTSI